MESLYVSWLSYAQFLYMFSTVWPGAQGDSVPDVLLDHWGSVHLPPCHHGSHWALVGDTEEDWKQTHCGPWQVSKLTGASLFTLLICHYSGRSSITAEYEDVFKIYMEVERVWAQTIQITTFRMPIRGGCFSARIIPYSLFCTQCIHCHCFVALSLPSCAQQCWRSHAQNVFFQSATTSSLCLPR